MLREIQIWVDQVIIGFQMEEKSSVEGRELDSNMVSVLYDVQGRC